MRELTKLVLRRPCRARHEQQSLATPHRLAAIDRQVRDAMVESFFREVVDFMIDVQTDLSCFREATHRVSKPRIDSDEIHFVG